MRFKVRRILNIITWLPVIGLMGILNGMDDDSPIQKHTISNAVFQAACLAVCLWALITAIQILRG